VQPEEVVTEDTLIEMVQMKDEQAHTLFEDLLIPYAAEKKKADSEPENNKIVKEMHKLMGSISERVHTVILHTALCTEKIEKVNAKVDKCCSQIEAL